MEKKDIAANHGFLFRIYPTKEQKEKIDFCFRIKRYVYNHLLGREIHITRMIELEYLQTIYGDNIKYDVLKEGDKNKIFILNGEKFEFSEEIKEVLKKFVKEIKTERNLYFKKFGTYKIIKERFLKESERFKEMGLEYVNSTTTQETILSLHDAFKNMVKTGAGYPKFKKKGGKQSYRGNFTFKDGVNQTFVLNHKEKNVLYNHSGDFKKCRANVIIPSAKKLSNRLGEIKIIITNEFFLKNWNDPSKVIVKSFTVSKDSAENYFISFACCLPDKKILPELKPMIYENTIGVDYNINNIVTTDDELNKHPALKRNIQKLKELRQKIDKNNQKLSMMVKGSNGYKNLRKKNNSLYIKITNITQYINNVASRFLVNTGKSIVLEDLSVKSMTKRSKNEKDREKQNTKRNKTIRKNLLGGEPRDFLTMTQRKGKEVGLMVVMVDPKDTTKTCSNCQFIGKKQPLRVRAWVCPNCGVIHDRDKNAALNIKNKGFSIENV
jgi:putative transposase